MRRRLVTMVVVVLTAVASLAIAPASPASAFSSPVSSIDFGMVGLNHKRWVAIPVTVDAGYYVYSMSWSNATLFGQSFDPCGATNGPVTCDVRMSFKPTAPGLQTSMLTVAEYNGSTTHALSVSLSGTGASSVPGKPAAHFGSKIVYGVASSMFGDSGFTLDGFGGLHTFSLPAVQTPAGPHGGPYWPGWNMARGVALLPNDKGGYVLDGYGGLHPFGVGGNAAPPAAMHGPYWRGWDIARGVTITEDGTGGYVLDGYGGLHRFSVGANPLPPAPTGGAYSPGFNIARGVTLGPLGGGYVLDGYGGIHRFATNGVTPPVLTGTPSWPHWDIARGIDYSGAYGRVTVVDAYGGLHLSPAKLLVTSVPSHAGALGRAQNPGVPAH